MTDGLLALTTMTASGDLSCGCDTLASGESAPALPPAPDPVTPSQNADPSALGTSAFWEGCIGMEGQLTGDGRFIEPDALIWSVPMPLRYVSSDVGEHGGAQVAGRILTCERRPGGVIWASGDYDFGSPTGTEAERQVREELTNGISMDLDDVSFEVRVAAELLAEMTGDPAASMPAAPVPNADGTVTVAKIKSSDEVRATMSARIRAATIVAIPAFADAKIYSTDAAPATTEPAVTDGTIPEGQMAANPFPPKPAGKPATKPDAPALDGLMPDGTTECSTDPDSPDFNPDCVATEPAPADGPPAKAPPKGKNPFPPKPGMAVDLPPAELLAELLAANPKNAGSEHKLIEWYEKGEGAAKIRWGTPGDFDRCRKIAGKHMPPNETSGFCFTGDTEFLTRDGITTFADAVGTDQFVLTNSFARKSPVRRDGHWVQAPVRSYGEQRVLSVTLKRGRLRKTIRATPEHVWFASTDARSANRLSMVEITTAELKPGMSLGSLMPKSVAARTAPSPFGIAAGAVFGDGNREPGTGARIDLWGDKATNLLPYFAGCRQSPIKNANGTLGVRIAGMPGSWKDFPSREDGASYLLGWLAGYIATDGHVTKQGSISLSSSRREHLEYASMVANRLGIASFPITGLLRSGFGGPPTMLYKLGFVGQTVPPELLLNPESRARLTEADPKFTSTRWAVESVEDHGEAEEVFCVEVPDTETFALADYIWVHNCANRHHAVTGEWPGRDAHKPGRHEEETIVAAGTYPLAPPSAWFDNPFFKMASPMTVTEDGRLFGHLAAWNTCHIGMSHQGCVTAPKSRSGYAYFHTGSIVTAENAEVPVGHITLDTTHAPTTGLSAAGAQNHYERTGHVVADVTAGEDAFGIWVSGALRPGISAAQVRELRAAPLSGDWRRVSGSLELVAALAVNVPGFPIPRPKGLVAGGVVQSLVASGMLPPRQVITPGMDGAFSMEDIGYLKRLADRERAEEATLAAAGSLPTAVELARRVRASALAMRAHSVRKP